MRFRVWRLGGFDSRSAVSRAALAALALWSSVPVQAAPPPGEAGCKVWNVQVGPSVFAIPYTPNLLAPPMVHVGDNSRASPWLREQVRCDAAPVKVWSLDFSLFIDDSTQPLVRRGELPEVLRVFYPAKPPDYMGFLLNAYKIDPALVKTPCRDGFDTGIAPRPAPAGMFGCRKDSGRALIWDCASSKDRTGTCSILENVGSVTLSYRWNRKEARDESAPRLDDAVIDFLNNLIVSGEKLPR